MLVTTNFVITIEWITVQRIRAVLRLLDLRDGRTVALDAASICNLQSTNLQSALGGNAMPISKRMFGMVMNTAIGFVMACSMSFVMLAAQYLSDPAFRHHHCFGGRCRA
jgi:hypothetical protein